MDQIQRKIIHAGYRLSIRSMSSITLILISYLVNVVGIITIIDPTKTQYKYHETNLVISFIEKIGENLYMRFILDTQQILYYLIILAAILLLEAWFIYLAVKQEIQQLGHYILYIISYVKNTLSLQFFALLAYSFKINTYFFIISLLTIIITSTTEYLSDQLNFTCMYSKKRSIDQRYNVYYAKAKIIIKIILGYIILRSEITLLQILSIRLLLVLVNTFLIWKLLVDKIQKYGSIYEIVYYLGCIFVICYNLVSFLATFIQLVHGNIELVLISLFIWSSLAFHNVLEYSKSQLLIRPVYQIKNYQEAITYIRLLYKTYQNIQQHGNSILFLGLIKDHTSQCNNYQCICKSRYKNISISLLKDGDFFIKFIELNIKILEQKFDNIAVKIASLAFYVQVMNKFPKFFYESQSFKKKNVKSKLALHLKYSLFIIEKQSLRQLGQKRSQNQNQNKKSLLIFKSQKKVQECYGILQKIILNLANLFKYNSRGSCGVGLLQKQLEQNYQLSMKMRQIFEQIKEQQTISMQLILLMFFFYRFIFNLPFKARSIKKRMEKLAKRFQNREIQHQNFYTSLHSENGCVIQSVLEKNIFGIISKVSKNAPVLFGYPSTQSMTGIDINKLLPRCIREQHQRVILQWIETGLFTKINKVQDTFCYNNEQKLMKVHLMSQVSVLNEQIVFCVGIMRSDDQNYMIINKQGQIDSYGESFFSLLQNQYRFLSVNSIFPKWYMISQNVTNQVMLTRTQFLIKNNKKQTGKSISCMQNNAAIPQVQNLTISIQIYKACVRDYQFIVIRKLALIKKESKRSIFSIENCKKLTEQSQNESINQKQKSKKTLEANDGKNYLMQIGSTSSTHNESFSSLWKLLQQISDRASAGHKIKYSLLTFSTIIQFFVLVLFVVALSCQHYLYTYGINSFNQVIYANAAVSDNMQLLEITFNNIMMYKQYCGAGSNHQECLSVKQSGKRTQLMLYQLMAKDIQDLIKNKTFFNHAYFFYEFTEVQMKINQNYTIPVGTFQFMEYFIRSAKKIRNQLQKTGQISSQYEYIIHNLKLNWGQMKRINHQNIKQYQAVGISQLDQCINYIIIISVISSIFVTIFILAQYSHYQRKNKLSNKVLRIFRLLPSNTNQILSQFYEQLEKTIKTKNIQKISQIDPMSLEDTHLNSHINFENQKNTKVILSFISLWLLLLFKVGLLSYVFNEYNSLWKQSLISIGALMDSENYLMENYFQLKAYYLHPPNSMNKQQFQQFLFHNLKQNENQFVKIAMKTSQIFSVHNKELAIQFSQLMITNICKATSNITSSQDSQVCYNSTKLKLYEQGILSLMTYFQRIVFQTVFRFNKSNNQTFQRDFRHYKLKDIDKYLFYMLKMYQISQAEMVRGLSIFIEDRLLMLSLIIFAVVMIFVVSFIYWLAKIVRKKKEMASIYGYVLSFPIVIIKQSKFIQQQLNFLLNSV